MQCLVISFLVLWSICLSSSLVYFKNGPEYLTRGTAQVFIPLTRFLQQSFVSSNFLALLRYAFLIFLFHFLVFVGVNFQYPQVFVGFLFSERSDDYLFGSSIPSVICLLPLFITSMAHFSMPNPIPISWLYILTVRIRVSNSFSFWAKSLMSSMYIE